MIELMSALSIPSQIALRTGEPIFLDRDAAEAAITARLEDEVRKLLEGQTERAGAQRSYGTGKHGR